MKLWQPNQYLNDGRFIIQKVLGSGGFGITYSAIENSRDKLVVIKTLNYIQQTKEDFQQQQVKFVNEALRLARCSHPHIVQVYEVIEEDGLLGMVMEFIDGEDLATYLDYHGQLSEDEALLYIDQIGQALEYVHLQGILHRDVKPSNILLRRGNSEAVLIDFGLARAYTLGQMNSMTNERTNGYAPIEQYKRQGIFGAYTDVYALAATLYTLLTKEVPISAEYRNEDIPLTPPKKFNPQMSDRVNYGIITGMELQPEKRPQSIREFRQLIGVLSTPPRKPEPDQLISLVGVDYQPLRDFLKQGKWKEADEETTRVMLTLAGKENDGWLSNRDIDTLPCEDLRTINQLWVNYSHGRFGFSVQKRICQDLGFNRGLQLEAWHNFGDTVGWRKNGVWLYYKDLVFDIKAPPAHLPGGVFWFDSWWGMYGWFLLDGVERRFSAVIDRIIRCNI
jgi:serine/threonine protein kinase